MTMGWMLIMKGPERVVKILSGDPSRGALALETEEPLLPGQKFQVSSSLALALSQPPFPLPLL